MCFERFASKKVLVTGHTGFKGSWLCLWLEAIGARVYGLSDGIPTTPSNFSATNLEDSVISYTVDIRDQIAVERAISEIEPDFVFHLAAQSLVRESYSSPIDTFSINALGSVNLLAALCKLKKPVIAVMITSDKAYENVEWVWGYRETDRLGGKDPYSASKGMAEIAIRSFVCSFLDQSNPSVRVGIGRAGNVIGGGDWARDRVIPDCVTSWSQGKSVNIRNPNSTRPWQHVLEPLSGYLVLASNLSESDKNHGEAFNFGPASNRNYPVSDLILEMAKHWNRVSWIDSSNSESSQHEAGLLKLNCDKALSILNWTAVLDFDQTVRMTVEWYKYYYECAEPEMKQLAQTQIIEYINVAKSLKVGWALNG